MTVTFRMRFGTAAAAALVLLLGVALTSARAADDRVEKDDTAHAAGALGGETADHGAANDQSLLKPFRAGLVTSLTTFIVFILLVAVLTRYAWGPIASGLKAREDKIRKDIADAEAARERADAALREYNARLAGTEQQIREMLAKATADGERIANNIRMDAQREAQESKERAQKDIEIARDQAINQLREEAVVLATSIAEKIVRRNLNPADQRDLLASSLDQLQTVGSR